MPAPENIRISIGDRLIMARKKIVAGNWKMNMTPSEAVALVETLKPLVATEDAGRSILRTGYRYRTGC